MFRPSLCALFLLSQIGCGRLGLNHYEPDGSEDASASGDARGDWDDDAERDGESGDVAVGDGDSLDSDSLDSSDLRPTIAIASPTSEPTITVYEPTIALSGSCSTDATALSTTMGSFTDSNCSDGDWAMAELDLTPGIHVITLSAQNMTGLSASDELEVTFELVSITMPTHRESFQQNGPEAYVAGTCSLSVIAPLTSSVGTFMDADCSDGTFALRHTLPLGSTSITIMANGGGPHQQDSIALTFDDEASTNEPLATSSDPASGANDNFPLIAGEGGEVVLFRDSSCQLRIGSGPNSAFSSAGVSAMVWDNSTTSIYTSNMDSAGNASPCSTASLTYNESSPQPPPCDTLVSTDMSFREFQTLLDGLEEDRALFDSDGVVAVCLDDDVMISTHSADEGGPIEIPGHGFQIFASSGTASFASHREGMNSGALFRTRMPVTNLGWANLSLFGGDGSGPAFDLAQSPGISYLRNITADLSSTAITTLAFTRIVEISGCSFTVRSNAAQPVLSIHNNGRIDIIRDSTFTRLSDESGYAISLNSSATINQMINVTIESAGGVLRMGNNGTWGGATQVAGIIDSRFRKIGDLTEQPMIVLQTYGGTPRTLPWFVTELVRDNVFCTVSGATPWSDLLVQDGVAYSSPTVPWTPSTDPAGSRGVQTFPWGDASTSGNTGFNQQQMWGGNCP